MADSFSVLTRAALVAKHSSRETRARRLGAVGMALAAAAVLVAPLVFARALQDPFRLPKVVASESLALLSLTFLAAGRALAPTGPAASLRRLPVVWAVVPVVAIASLGLLTSKHLAHVREALPSLWVAAAAMIGWSLGLGARSARRLLDLQLLPAALLAAIAVLQFHQVYQPFELDASQYDGRLQVTSLAGNPADLGAYLVLPLVIAQLALWEALGRRSRPLRLEPRDLLLGAGLALGAYALVVTATLTVLAAAAAATLVLWLVLARRRRRVAIALFVVGVAGAGVLASAPLRARAVEKVGELRRGEINNLLTGRLDGWRAGLHLARERPLTGVGHGAFRAEFMPAKLALLDRGVPFFDRQLTVVFANAHNEAIEVVAEWGVPGLLAAAWAGAVLVWCARRIATFGRRSKGAPATSVKHLPQGLQESAAGAARGDGALAWAGLASFAALAAASFPFRIALTGYQAVLFFAWMLAAAAATMATGESASSEGHRSPRRGVVAVGLAVALLAACAVHLRRAADRMEASATLRRVEGSTLRMMSAGRASPAEAHANRRALLDALAQDPAEPAIPIAIGAQYALLGRHREAIEWYETALRLEPRPEAYFSRGVEELEEGNEPAALESFRLAVRLSPQLAFRLPERVRREL